LLQLENTSLQKVYPFKFHSQWLAEKDFNDIVYKLWKDPKYLKEGDSQRRFGWKLKDLKAETKRWAKDFKGPRGFCSGDLEANIKYHMQRFSENKPPRDRDKSH
jgi:hypothetical protein